MPVTKKEERKTCNKFPYRTRKEAIAVLKYNNSNEIYGKPYRCQICNFWHKVWHLGHQPPKKSSLGIWRKKDRKCKKNLCDLIDKLCGVKK